MEKNLPIHLQEVIFGSSNKKISKQISALESAGKIRKIAQRLYSSNLSDPVDDIVRRNLFQILSKLYPGATLSHRSAFEFQPTKAGHIFLTYKYTKKVSLAGITIRFLEGQTPIEGDNPFFDTLFASQRARAFLENLQPSRGVGPTAKNLTLPELEEKLEAIIRINGETAINELRDKAKIAAETLNMRTEFETLNSIISALLSTHSSKVLSSPLAMARAFGLPYDPARLTLFEKLFVTLQTQEFANRPDKNDSLKSYRNFGFFESYFSNYIEGTIFEVEEAKEIIATNQPMPTRNADSHDILGTYQLVANKKEMSITPASGEELMQLLLYRHKVLMRARIDKNPGEFKDKNNRAGETEFVDFNLVKGTLIKGFDYYNAIQQPFGRAVFMMFLVSEVHPFLDGNGRMARVMMSCELTKAGQAKMIIPTVFRDDYLGALRKLTRQNSPDAYIRMMQRIHEFSANIYGENIDAMEDYLKQCNAFMEHTDGKLTIIPRDFSS